MGFFEAAYHNGSYTVAIGGLDQYDSYLTARFDTGAINSIISVEEITTDVIDKSQMSSLISEKAIHKSFRSASGNEMEGYLVCADNITISGAKIKRFYYYLIMNVDIRIALLGDDFLSKCIFTHDIDGNIEVKKFDENKYENGFTQFISKSDVDTLMELCCVKGK